uniref:Methyltransferase FkbM domain-containing protein n=1 Tax=viral metagenome TaxID=1070528 RepID=A0A6C0K2D2_9ZZZZ
MLIKQETVIAALGAAPIRCKGVLHVGAHECEELPFYQRLGIAKENCVWLDAVQSKVDQALAKGIPNVFKAVVTDKDDDTVTFRLTNNVQSSSVLEFGTHAKHHPHVHFVSETQETTVTLDTFFKRQNLDPSHYDFWNFDIQGAEMLALKGATNALKYAKALYLEVNTEEVYKGCAKMDELDAFLSGLGFRRVLTDITEYGWGDALYVRDTPKLSLCIPTMNRWSFLQENLPKYLNNPHIDEIVISDENGADVEKIRETFSNPKLKLFVNEERLGAFFNKEIAVRRASNKWVALIDSDNFAPIPYFEQWIQFIQNNPLAPHTVYAPSRTIPTKGHNGFDYRSFIGKQLTKSTYNALKSDNWMECVINTGNYIVNRDFYLQSFDPDYSDLCKITNAWEAKLRTWLLLNKGANFVFPANFEYYHSVHDGSLYINTEKEIDAYRSRMTDMYNSLH